MDLKKAKELVNNYMISTGAEFFIQYDEKTPAIPYCDSISNMFVVFDAMCVEVVLFDSYKGEFTCSLDYHSGEADYDRLNSAIKSAAEYILEHILKV